MHRESRRIRIDPEGLRIYSGRQAQAMQARGRGAGPSPGWVEIQRRWILARAGGERQACALGVLVIALGGMAFIALGAMLAGGCAR